jgi:hypothetical protein
MAADDEGFEVLPPGVAIDVDDELASQDTLDDAPFAMPETTTPAPPPLGATPAYDFVSQSFIPAQSGAAQKLRGLAALQQWCEKCLLTRQGEAAAVDPSFGVAITPMDLLADGLLEEGELADAFDDWTRAFKVHPRVSDVEDWHMELVDDGESASVACFVVAEGVADPVRLDFTIGA